LRRHTPPRVRATAQAARLHGRWVDVQAEVSRAVAAYAEATSGPNKWPRLTAFLQAQYGHMVADFVQRCEAEADKKVGGWVCVCVCVCACVCVRVWLCLCLWLCWLQGAAATGHVQQQQHQRRLGHAELSTQLG
jgi:hypothetical protein